MCGRNIIRAILGASIFISVRLYGYTEPGIEFRANRGQWDPEILYRAELNNGYLLVTRKGLSYLFCRHPNLKHFKSGGLQADENGLRKMSQGKMTEDPFKGEALFLTMAFSGSPESAEIIPSEQKEGYYNYFLGNNPARWAGHVPSYGEITYRNIYPGIHFRLYSSKGFLKYDITVDPGAGVEPLKLVYEGMDSIFRQYNNIYIRTPAGEIIENRPYAYQLRGKDTVNVPCFFRLAGHTITFICPQGYNRKRPLIIDPLLVFSTYSGATMDNWGNTATYDSHGNVYSGGTVWDYFHKGSLPVTKGAFQTSFGGVWDVADRKSTLTIEENNGATEIPDCR